MTGSANNREVRRVFQMDPMPLTAQQVGGNGSLASRIIQTRLGHGVVADGDGYWMSDEIMAEGIELSEKEIVELQRYIHYLQTQRIALAARGLPTTKEGGVRDAESISR